MLGLRPMEIALIVFALLLLFGASRLPQLGSSLSAAYRNFKRGINTETEEEKAADKKLSQTDQPPIASQDKAATKQS